MQVVRRSHSADAAVVMHMVCLPAGVAWHPRPSQTSDTVQLVTASADKTARVFSGEGKQLGSLKVSLQIRKEKKIF